MNSIVLIAVVSLAAAASGGIATHRAYVEPLAKSAAIQGPSSRSTVVGPDGSVVEAVAPGGRIETAAYAAPITAHVAHDVPVYATHGAIVSHAVPRTVIASPTASILSAPSASIIADPSASIIADPSASIVADPSASIVAHHHASPLVSTLIASPYTASGYPLYAPGSGLEGQYVPDHLEKLYDDGSYKGEIYH